MCTKGKASTALGLKRLREQANTLSLNVSHSDCLVEESIFSSNCVIEADVEMFIVEVKQ